jgi:hypothetical protein
MDQYVHGFGPVVSTCTRLRCSYSRLGPPADLWVEKSSFTAHHGTMSGRDLVHRDSAMGPQYVGPVDDQAHLMSSPGRWRRFSLRWGNFEIGYASARIKQPRYRVPALREEALPPAARTSLRGRFLQHLAFTLAVFLFLGGSVSLLAMQSGAFEMNRENRWPIVDAAELSKPRVNTAAVLPPAAMAHPEAGPVVQALQPSIVKAAIRESLAEFTRAHPVQQVNLGKSSVRAPIVDAPIASMSAGSATVLTGPLDRMPAVAAAIKRAMATGEVQNWTAGNYQGVVVVGESYEAGGSVCREGSILAQDGGQTSRTQPFERCLKARGASADTASY